MIPAFGWSGARKSGSTGPSFMLGPPLTWSMSHPRNTLHLPTTGDWVCDPWCGSSTHPHTCV